MRAPRVVLVEPQIPANLGFIARVLDNFGVEDWAAVGGVDWRGSEAERTGAAARDSLAALRRVDTMQEAIGDCTHLVGLTARGGHHRSPIPLPELPAVAAQWGPEARVALLFGREDRGLETKEAERCTALASIPTRGLASLNVSHAVAVTLYAWTAEAGEIPEALHQERRWADVDEKVLFARRAVAALARHGYPDQGGELRGALRRLLALPIEGRDLRVLQRIVRHVNWLDESK